MEPWEHTPNKDSLGGGLMGGVCIGSIAIEQLDRERFKNFSARPRPSLCEIRKFSSISRFEHESQKKVSSMPRPRPRFRPRFSDLSFHLQPCSVYSVLWPCPDLRSYPSGNNHVTKFAFSEEVPFCVDSSS